MTVGAHFDHLFPYYYYYASLCASNPRQVADDPAAARRVPAKSVTRRLDVSAPARGFATERRLIVVGRRLPALVDRVDRALDNGALRPVGRLTTGRGDIRATPWPARTGRSVRRNGTTPTRSGSRVRSYCFSTSLRGLGRLSSARHTSSIAHLATYVSFVQSFPLENNYHAVTFCNVLERVSTAAYRII